MQKIIIITMTIALVKVPCLFYHPPLKTRKCTLLNNVKWHRSPMREEDTGEFSFPPFGQQSKEVFITLARRTDVSPF
jgi:hypothetical protein